MKNFKAHDTWGVMGNDATDKPADLAHRALHLGHILGLRGKDLIAPVNLHALGRQILRGVGDERRLSHQPQITLLQAPGMHPQQHLFPGTVVENIADVTTVHQSIITRASHIIALPAPDETSDLCRLFAADKDAACKTMCVLGEKPDLHNCNDTPEMTTNLDMIQFFNSFPDLQETLSRKLLNRYDNAATAPANPVFQQIRMR